MSFKKWVTFALSAFVAVSLITLVVKGLRATPQDETLIDNGIVACYFYENVRCVTCEAIEANADRAIHEEFAKELADGRLHWRTINSDKPGNEHFKIDFDLAAPLVVLIEMQEGQVVRWDGLFRVWELKDDEAAMIDYIRTETRAFLSPLSDDGSQVSTASAANDVSNAASDTNAPLPGAPLPELPSSDAPLP